MEPVSAKNLICQRDSVTSAAALNPPKLTRTQIWLQGPHQRLQLGSHKCFATVFQYRDVAIVLQQHSHPYPSSYEAVWFHHPSRPVARNPSHKALCNILQAQGPGNQRQACTILQHYLWSSQYWCPQGGLLNIFWVQPWNWEDAWLLETALPHLALATPPSSRRSNSSGRLVPLKIWHTAVSISSISCCLCRQGSPVGNAANRTSRQRGRRHQPPYNLVHCSRVSVFVSLLSCARKRFKVADLVLLNCCASLLGRFIVIGSQGLASNGDHVSCPRLAISRASCCFCRTRASVEEVSVGWRRPPRWDGAAQYRSPTSIVLKACIGVVWRTCCSRQFGTEGPIQQAGHEKFLLPHYMWVRYTFIGCWDKRNATGQKKRKRDKISNRFSGQNTKLHPGQKKHKRDKKTTFGTK